MHLRNIFYKDEESEEWRQQTDKVPQSLLVQWFCINYLLCQFPNKIPRFQSKSECLDFLNSNCRQGSNPDYPQLHHSVTTLIDWAQIETHLLPRIKKYSFKWKPILPDSSQLQSNRFFKSQVSGDGNSANPIYEYMTSRLNLSIHKEMSAQSTMNTLRYMFFHMRCGIFVMIRNNEVVIFCPFLNRHYRNTWGNALKVQSADGSIESYYEEKSHHYRKENYLRDMSEW